VPDTPAAARYINETIAWFAMHRHGDPESAVLDDDTCRRASIPGELRYNSTWFRRLS
jgi:hypothetical protein